MLAPTPLLDWVPPPKPILRTGPLPRLVLLPDCCDANGEPRAGLMIPGHRLPIAFPSMAAAVAELRRMEAGAHG
ncbi:hypothetical protein [Roseicella aerolata]|uniref:Uncharacterized protein n=1 Tax=Roseicella aerolata TaxID=2883479 RepID=A0A9X1IA53_9PROT|nr:hypothetical protein [Roseicella aerolata]MCB4820752.1 hypothetical protein [Roseicella aerolata]